jgi:hypothetical protein
VNPNRGPISITGPGTVPVISTARFRKESSASLSEPCQAEPGIVTEFDQLSQQYPVANGREFQREITPPPSLPSSERLLRQPCKFLQIATLSGLKSIFPQVIVHDDFKWTNVPNVLQHNISAAIVKP